MREFDISPIKDEFKEEIDSIKKFVTRPMILGLEKI